VTTDAPSRTTRAHNQDFGQRVLSELHDTHGRKTPSDRRATLAGVFAGRCRRRGEGRHAAATVEQCGRDQVVNHADSDRASHRCRCYSQRKAIVRSACCRDGGRHLKPKGAAMRSRIAVLTLVLAASADFPAERW